MFPSMIRSCVLADVICVLKICAVIGNNAHVTEYKSCNKVLIFISEYFVSHLFFLEFLFYSH
jgi:hypothetical protein